MKGPKIGLRARSGDLAPLGVATVAATVAYMLLLAIAERAGMPPGYGFIVTGVLLVAVIVLPGLAEATASTGEWLGGKRRERPLATGMASAAVLLAMAFHFAIPGAFFAGSAGALAWVAGPLAGVAIGAIALAPYLRKTGTMSATAFLRQRFRHRAAAIMAMALVATIVFLTVWTQIQLAGALSGLFFPFPPETASIAAAALAFAVVAPGGLSGLVRVNLLVFAFAATALLAPVVWLAGAAAGLPLPQLTYGATALTEVANIETQSAQLGLRSLADSVALALPSGAGAGSAAAMAVFLALGFAALPPMLAAFGSGNGARGARNGASWAILFAAFVLSAAPAIAAFAKLAVYNSIFGITAGEIESAASWLLQWGRVPSPLDGTSPALTLCGQLVPSVTAAVAACGDTEYALGPADILFSSDIIGMALPDLGLLPTVFAMVTGAAVVALCISGAAAGAMSFAGAVGASLSPERRAPELSRLFLHRLLLGCVLAATAWLSILRPAFPLEPALHALALAGGLLLPALLVSIHADRLHGNVLAAAIGAGGLVYALWFAVAFAGPDAKPGTGDEIALAIPALADLPLQFHAALAAFATAAVTAGILSAFVRGDADQRHLEALRTPDGQPAADMAA